MKKTTKFLTMALTAVLAVCTLTACGGDSAKGNVITFGTNPEFPPFEYVTSNGVLGEFDGIDMAIAQRIGADNGMEVKMESMEFDSLLVALQNGQIDAVIAGMTATDERKETPKHPPRSLTLRCRRHTSVPLQNQARPRRTCRSPAP